MPHQGTPYSKPLQHNRMATMASLRSSKATHHSNNTMEALHPHSKVNTRHHNNNTVPRPHSRANMELHPQVDMEPLLQDNTEPRRPSNMELRNMA